MQFQYSARNFHLGSWLGYHSALHSYSLLCSMLGCHFGVQLTLSFIFVAEMCFWCSTDDFNSGSLLGSAFGTSPATLTTVRCWNAIQVFSSQNTLPFAAGMSFQCSARAFFHVHCWTVLSATKDEIYTPVRCGDVI